MQISVQNPIDHGQIASLLSIKINGTGNNYPQSYPVAENMLVNTNRTYFKGNDQTAKRRKTGGQMKQRPRPGGLGAL